MATQHERKKPVDSLRSAFPRIKPKKDKCKSVKANKHEKEWISSLEDTTQPPSAFTITQTRQAYAFSAAKKSENIKLDAADVVSNLQWLKSHSMESRNLTIKDFIKLGRLPQQDFEENMKKLANGMCDPMALDKNWMLGIPSQLHYDPSDVMEFEYNLYQSISELTSRIAWFLSGTRKVFGLVNNYPRLGLLVDSSCANLAFGRGDLLKHNLSKMVMEQLNFDLMSIDATSSGVDLTPSPSLYIATYGTNVQALWPNPIDINSRAINEARIFLGERLCESGGSNLLAGLRHMFKVGRRDFDCILVVVGSHPDQTAQQIISYVQQELTGLDKPTLHLVSYDCPNPILNQMLVNLASFNERNIFHCYSTRESEAAFQSDEIVRLTREIERGKELLAIVKRVREDAEGVYKSTELAVADMKALSVGEMDPNFGLAEELAMLKGKLDLSALKIDAPLKPSSSHKWLASHGLKAKKLLLHQVLASNAYDRVSEFIPSIGKTVAAQVYEQFMPQIEWPDGSIKNVHVDFAALFEYQKQISHMVKLYEKRVHWLTTASRRIFGTIVESRIVFIVDVCAQNSAYLVHIKYSLRTLLEQQMAGKTHFNLITLGGRLPSSQEADRAAAFHSFREGMVEVTEANLQTAWTWLNSLRCGGSRCLLPALKSILEGNVGVGAEFHRNRPDGIYLFTSGVPDQDCDLLSAYLDQTLVGTVTRIHIVLYNVNESDAAQSPAATPARYASVTQTADHLRRLANLTGGRFHWFRETGIIDSDDIRLLLDEIDMAVRHSNQCLELVNEARNRGDKYTKEEKAQFKTLDADVGSRSARALPPPLRSTALTEARRLAIEKKRYETEHAVPKALAYREGVVRDTSRKLDPMQSVCWSPGKFRAPVPSARQNGSDKKRSTTNRGLPPRREDYLDAKSWLHRYGLRALGLDLLKLVAGSTCTHECAFVPSSGTLVEARYCSDLLPIFNINGSMKHLHFSLDDLSRYSREVEKVLARYCARIEWMLSGSRRMFSVLTEKRVVLLIDISGSMSPYLTELKQNLVTLIWEQIFPLSIAFNIIAFNQKLYTWNLQRNLAAPDETSCHDAVAWLDRLFADGGTATKDAVTQGMELLTRKENRETDMQDSAKCEAQLGGLYLLTDGKPDDSCSSTLTVILNRWNSLLQLHNKRVNRYCLPINTISFNCVDDAANSFLKKLALETRARYHRVPNEEEANVQLQKLRDLREKIRLHTVRQQPSLPRMESDDLAALLGEVDRARSFMDQSRHLAESYHEMRNRRAV